MKTMTHTIEPLSIGIQPLKSLVVFESDEESPANIITTLFINCLHWFNKLYKDIVCS